MTSPRPPSTLRAMIQQANSATVSAAPSTAASSWLPTRLEASVPTASTAAPSSSNPP